MNIPCKKIAIVICIFSVIGICLPIQYTVLIAIIAGIVAGLVTYQHNRRVNNV